ncbi:hypothetical protein GCM10023107_12150 [Actinoplanes octamycinicus]
METPTPVAAVTSLNRVASAPRAATTSPAAARTATRLVADRLTGHVYHPTKSWVIQVMPLLSRTTLSPIRVKLLLSRFRR